jgi:uncharacterized SAM-binding protein YcdF (DUF218 family)
MMYDLLVSAREIFLYFVPLAFYWLLLALALAVWLRARAARRRSAVQARPARITLSGALGLSALLCTVLSLPVGPHLVARLLVPSDVPVLTVQGSEGLSAGGRTDVFIAVFSGGAYEAQPGVWLPSSTSVRRVLSALPVAARLNLPLAISGGSVTATAPAEADVIADRLTLPPGTVLDRSARNTYENGLGFARLAGSRGWTGAVVASDYMHLRRAAACLRAAGLQPTALLPATMPRRLGLLDIVPNPASFGLWRAVSREVAGIAFYLAAGRIGWEDL